MVPFTTYPTTPTRIVNASKCNLLKLWGLKTLNFGHAPNNIDIYYTTKDDRIEQNNSLNKQYIIRKIMKYIQVFLT